MPIRHVFAINVRTGEQLWHYQQKLAAVPLCCGPNNRGVALLGDKVWETQVADPQMGYSLTMAPIVYKDKVIVGIGGAEYGIRGMISAYNVSDGSLAWCWFTSHEPTEKQPDGTMGWEGVYAEKADGINSLNRDIAAEQVAAKSGKYDDAWKRGGASNWITNSIDPKIGMMFATLGNPSPDLDGSIRPGDNRRSVLDAGRPGQEDRHRRSRRRLKPGERRLELQRLLSG